MPVALTIPMATGAEITFDQVVRQRETQILRIAYRVLGNWADAEDIAQEAFVRLHRHGLDFASHAALGAWLCRVTVNLCIDRTRSRKPGVGEAIDLSEMAGHGPSPEAAALREGQKRELEAALRNLSPRERAAIVLREIEGFSTAEVAGMLGSTETTVRSQISKGIERLRSLLGGNKQ